VDLVAWGFLTTLQFAGNGSSLAWEETGPKHADKEKWLLGLLLGPLA